MKRMNWLAAGVLLAAMAAGCNPMRSVPGELGAASTAIQESLYKLNDDTFLASKAIAEAGSLDSPKTRAALAGLCQRYPYVADCATISPKGILVAVEPKAYQSHQGADLSSRPLVARMLASRQPMLTDAFTAVEGFTALALQRPVMTQDGTFIGAVSVLLKPADFLASAVAPQFAASGWECTVMQPDGHILYDADPKQVGTNLFTDALFKGFPALRELGRQIAEQPSGYGTYRFLGKDGKTAITKECYWSTVGLFGAEWRVSVFRQIQ
jgi:hypothetical protein